jgi:hypothetical protein
MRAIVSVITAAAFLSAFAGTAMADEDDNQAALAKALPDATVSLQQALKASEREGKPISAKYELDHGALQLSVYTKKGETFSEVIIDHKTGTIAKAEKITDAEDLEDAQGQARAMSQAKVTLESAIEKATKTNSGYRAVSIIPVLAAVVPMATVTLMKGEDVKKVPVQLD